MKNLHYLIILFSSIQLLTSCNKNDEKPSSHILNYVIDCTKDSTYYYYTINYEKIYLDISTLCISIKFSDTLTEVYINTLLANNPELNSISIIDIEENFAYGYLKADVSCDEIKTLLTRLTLETGILMANPNFILKECIVRGRPLNDEDCLLGLTDDFVVSLKNSVQPEKLTSLINLTKTKLVRQTNLYYLISTDKNSMGNSLELSRYFYETGYFEYSYPSFRMKVILFKK